MFLIITQVVNQDMYVQKQAPIYNLLLVRIGDGPQQ